MRLGQLDRRITIRAVTIGRDAAGQVVRQESDLATVSAARMEQRLSEVFAADADQRSDRIVWRIRWREGVLPDMIVVHEAERFELRGVQEYGRRHMLDLICERTGETV